MTKLLESHGPCSECGSSDARSTYDDGHSYCFSCGTYTPPNTSSDNYTYEYLPWRGVSKATMEFYGVKTKVGEGGKPISVGFKYPNGHEKTRTIDRKGFFLEKNKPISGLFGQDKFAAGGYKTVTITEGELDALSLYQVLRQPVVSVQGASSAGRDCANARSWLNSFDRIYLAFDSDAPGCEAVKSVSKLFDYGKVYVLKFSNRKDANEFLQAGEEDPLRNVWFNAKRYLPDNIESSLEAFKNILLVPPKTGFAYPFKKLTEMTYGIRFGETVLFTAMEKVGKTELMHFIEHKLLKETNHNVAAIYLEEPKSRHLQALSGIELGKPVHLPDCSCTSDELTQALVRVVGRDDRLHIYSHFGSSDPDVLLDSIRFLVSARECRFVILDHLSMVVSGNTSDDERRQLDYLSTRLEMLVKELDFSLIMVSHVNDEGKTRGSRWPTKVADITVTAMRDMQNPDPQERRAIYLRVLFNRFCSKTGPAGKLIFNPDTYAFLEVDEGEENGWKRQPQVATQEILSEKIREPEYSASRYVEGGVSVGAQDVRQVHPFFN